MGEAIPTATQQGQEQTAEGKGVHTQKKHGQGQNVCVNPKPSFDPTV